MVSRSMLGSTSPMLTALKGGVRRHGHRLHLFHRHGLACSSRKSSSPQ